MPNVQTSGEHYLCNEFPQERYLNVVKYGIMK